MASKYDLQSLSDVVNIASERNNCYKIADQQSGCEDREKSEMCGKEVNECKPKRLNIRREEKDVEGSKKDKKGLAHRRNVKNAIIQREQFKTNEGLDGIKRAETFGIPGLLINIQEESALTLSSFQILSDTFQQYHTHCCKAFHICQNESTTETAEQRAAVTYAITRLLFFLGYKPERIAVSGLDTLMLLAAKDAMKLEDACFTWKTISSLIKDGNSSQIAEKINTILLKLGINFQETISLINIQRLRLSDIESITAAILTNDEQSQQFLNGQMESYMIFGSSNDRSMKRIENFDDLMAFIIYQKDSKLLAALELLIHKKSESKKELNQFVEEILRVQINLKEKKYLLAHRIHNCNILSAATLLTAIYNALSNKRRIIEDITFVLPVTFEPKNNTINFKILISPELCTVTYSNYQCATFRCDEFYRGVHKRSITNLEHRGYGTNKLDASSMYNTKSVTEEEFYTEMEHHHYQYDEEFRCVRKLIINEDNSGTVELAPSTHLDVLIDGVMQAIVFIYIQQYGKKFITLVPFHIRQMEIVSITEQTVLTGRYEDANVMAFVKAKFKNGKFLGSFEFASNEITVAAHAISFYPMMPDNMMRSLKKERALSSDRFKSLIDSCFEEPLKPKTKESIDKNTLSQMPLNQLTRQDKSLICIKSIACRLPKTVHDPADFWDALKTGQIMASKIPCSRISGRDSLAQGKYGQPIRCANFLANDISHFDATFFGISRSEAEKIDPQQRLLLECVYECMENAGLTSLRDAGFFVGFMSNEYPDIAKSQDAVSMLGSSASIVSGRLNYLFGSTGPAVTIDTACSSSLVALQAAIHALLDGHCTIAIVAGVNLILTEQSIGQRANGNLLADDGMCRSFDARASGYGRADGCAVLLLSTENKAIEGSNFEATIISTHIGHNGQSASLTAPNGRAQQKLLQDCLSKTQGNRPVKYWETHGTGTVIGDSIELKALQANLQHCLISTVKTHFGHAEAAAGAAGLAKILLQFKHEYIPEHGSYEFLQNFGHGTLYLPVIGEEWEDEVAGISSFGISGTNAMAILQSEKRFLKQSKKRMNTKRKTCICPISAKSKESLSMLTTTYQIMLENTFRNVEDICSTAALHRNHMQYRAVILLRKGKIMRKWMNCEKSEKQVIAIGLKLHSNSCLNILSTFYLTFSKFRMIFKTNFPLMKNFLMQKTSKRFRRLQSVIILSGFLSLITFLHDVGIKIKAIYACDNLSLTAALVITGKLKFANVSSTLYSNIQIFTQKIFTKNAYIDNYKWYKLCTVKDGEIFECEFMEMIATSYLQGDCINWTCLYSSPFYPVTLPNYQFKRESYWITENSTTIDHWLIGRLIKEEENECVFINQISKMTNGELMTVKYGGQMRFSFGICCEAIIQSLQLTFLKNTSDQSQFYLFKDITMVTYGVQENDWIKTTIKKYTDEKYHVKLTYTSNIICEANIMIFTTHTIPIKALNATEFVTKSNFYETLKDKGIFYDHVYQTITRASSNEKIFVTKCRCQIFLLMEAIIQAACYHDLLNPYDIYGENKFTIKNFNFHTFLSESMYVWIENNKIFAYNRSDNKMVASGNLNYKKIKGKFDKRKCQKRKNEVKSNHLTSTSSITYQNYVEKVRQAVEDIRKDDNPISNGQLSVSFTELGLDSLSITDLANRLNTIYFPNLQIGAVDLFNYSNISLLTDAIYGRKISSRTISYKENKMDEISDDIIPTFDKHTDKRSQSEEKHSMDEDGSCAYTQIFLKEQTRNDCVTLIITDKQFISAKKLINELVVVVTSKKQKRTTKDDIGIIHLNTRNPGNFERNFLSHLSDHKSVAIRFELSRSFPLRYLAEVLLHLTKVITESNHTYIFSSKCGYGSANAFALGFAKSLSAELYPKVQYNWNFILQKISNLKKYMKELRRSLQTDNENSKERWLITGGLGGIGWQMAKFIGYNRKVSHLFLLGRKKPNEAQSEEMDKMRDDVGVDVRAVSVDLTSKMQMKEFFKKLQISLTSVIHSAGCIHDVLASKQDISTFRRVAEAKCDGLLILQKLCRSHPIKHFIVNSSISAIIGNAGQCNYSAANAFVDEIMVERRAKGLPATTINWGNWLEIGMAVKANEILNKMGFIGLKTQKAMSYLQIAIDYAPARMIVIQVDVRKVLHYRPDLVPVFLNNANENNTLKTGKDVQKALKQSCQLYEDQSKSVKLKRNVEDNGGSNIHHIKVMIVKCLEEVTGEAVTTEDYEKSFMDLGLDSFKIYRFVNGLTKRLEMKSTLNVLAIFEHPTIAQLSHHIGSQSCRIKEHLEITNNDDNFPSMNEVNLENIAKNFRCFVFHSKDGEQLQEENFRFIDLFEKSSQISEVSSDQSFARDQSNDYAHVIWGLKYKMLRNSLQRSETIPNIKQCRKPIVSFIISGQGSQVWNMGRQLSCIFPFFRKKFDETLRAAARYMPDKRVHIRDVIYQWRYRKLLYHTEYAQPIIYCFAYSLAKFYEFCGVQANFFLGHSIGEIVACALAGRISFDDALKLVIRRGEILALTRGKGKMIAVRKNDARKLQRCSGMSRAAENSHKQTVLSGDNRSAKLCLHFARLYQCPATVIDDRYPFHSSAIDDKLLHQYVMECKKLKLQKVKRRNIVSSSTGKFMKQQMESIAPIKSTVLFKECVKTLYDNNANIWLEIGNGEILTTFLRTILESTPDTLICSAIGNNKKEVDSFIHSLCQLQTFGVKIKWERICNRISDEEIVNCCGKTTDEKVIVGKESDMELIEQHLIHGEIILPAAFIISMFVEFVKNSLQTYIGKSKIQSLFSDRKTIIFEVLRLEKQVNETDLRKLGIKFDSSELILINGINRYSSCRLGTEGREKILEQMKQMIALNTLRIKYEQLRIKMNALPYQAFYETMRRRGLQYGPKYQVLREIYYKDHYIGATLINVSDLTELLDGALQLLSAALLTTSKSSVYIPFAIDDIIIKYDMKTDHSYFRAYGIISKRIDNVIKGSVIIYGDGDQIILNNVTAIDISAKSNTSIKRRNPSDSQYSTDAKMKPATTTDASDTIKHIEMSSNNSDNVLTTEIKTDNKLSIRNETVKIEIIGYVGQFPGSAVDCASLWNNLKAGTSLHFSDNIQKLQTDITIFNPVQFGITPKEATYIDPQQRILLEMTQKTIENAGLKRLDSDTGVFVGVSSSDFAQKAYGEIEDISSYLGTGTNQSVLAGRIAYWFNLKGPTMVIDTACSSFFSALVVACDNIRMGNCRAALVGAVNIILNSKPTSVLEKAQMLTKTGFCKVFDEDADGYVRSEGAAMILIQRVAERDCNSGNQISFIHQNDTTFTIESYGMAHNGRSNGLTIPSGISECELIDRVNTKRTNMSMISWVEAHAAGTPLGDPIEAEAIARALADLSRTDRPIYMTSVKSSIGHCEAAAGAASLIMALEAYRHQYLPPIQHFKLLNRNIMNNAILNVPVIGEELPNTFDILINSFGFSGTNVSVILRGCNRREMKKNEQTNRLVVKQKLLFDHSPCILLYSLDDSESFKLASEKLEQYVKQTSYSLATVCACSQNLRSTGRYRIALPIKRHTQKWISFQMINKPQKWTKVVLNLGKSPEPSMIAELCTVYRSFRRIFIDYIKSYKCANIFVSSERTDQFKFEYISKLSLVTFLLAIGIIPSAIIASNKIDRNVIKIIERKYKAKYALEAVNNFEEVSYQRCNSEIRQERVFEDSDCILNVQSLLIEKPEMICDNNWKGSFTNQFVDTICQLHEHFIDINWQVLHDQAIKTCLLPDPEYSKKKYWPFLNRNMQSIDYNNSSYDELSFLNLQPEISPTTKKPDEASPTVDSFNTDNLDSTKMGPINRHYLYKLIQEKCIALNPRRISLYIAINLTDPTTIIGQQAIFTDRTNDNDDISRIKKQLDFHKCTKLVLEWVIDEKNLLENTIRQSMLVIGLWKILLNSNNSSHLNKNTKLCLIVFATTHTTGNQRLRAPFSALLKTLAMEHRNVNFKSIHTDIIDQQLLYEISDENFLNEIICYNNGNRYVERLQEINDNIRLAVRNVNRILITGNIRGIAMELIELLEPDLAVVVSRSIPSTCNNGGSGSVIKMIQADCTNYKQMEKIFMTFAPFDVVFHCAATISNSLMENMNVKLFEMACSPKVIGLQNIIKLSKAYTIGKIVAFSSAATIFGSAGQANYVVANELMEYLMMRYVPDGLFISWGPWDGRGLLVGEHMASIRKQVQDSGWKLMRVEQVARLCCKLLSSTGHHIAMDVNFDVLRKKRPYLSSFLKCIPDNDLHRDDHLRSDSKSGKGFNEIIRNCVMEVSGIANVRPDVGFMSMGIDSLMISEMLTLLKERLNLNIPLAVLYEYSTVETLSQYLSQNIQTSCKLKNDMETIDRNDGVAIIGYSGAFSGAPDDETFWHSLLNGKELIEHHKKTVSGNYETIEAVGIVPDIDKFDYRFWKMSPDDASYIDPQIRKFIEHAYTALERSGLVRLKNKLRIAVVAGAEPSEYRPKSRRIGGIEDLYEMNQKDFVAAWTSHLLDLRGPSFGVYSACSTALTAIIQALHLLQENQCDVALAGAVSLTIPRTDDNNSLQGMVLSSDGHCRPFDHKSSGTVRGSAVGVVVLRRLSEARHTNAPLIVKIVGYGITNDGLLKSSFMAPNVSGQLTCIKEAVEMTGTAEVDYIECHGTGTTTGDLIELTAMSQVYHRDTLIGSVKANIGHALAGAGIGAVIKLCKIAEMRIIPKQINFDKLNENLKDVSFKITQRNIELQKKKLRLAMNSSGIGGTNAHIIIENDIHMSSINQLNIEQCFYALTISGKTENACIRLCHRIANYLRSEMNLTEAASTLQNYREHFEYRIGVSVKSAMDAINHLKDVSKVEKAIELKRENVAFYFAPQGLEYANMGLEAMAYNEVFRETMQKCCIIATKLIGVSFQGIIHPQEKFDSPQYAAVTEQPYSQVATFIVCFALAEQLRAWGIEGCVMIGHSLGEYVAAAQAGVFDVETALQILFKRGCLIMKTERAKTLAVKYSEFGLIDAKYSDTAETVDVSAILSSDLKCLVGKPERIDELKEKLEKDGMHCRKLETNYGFHSSFMDSILEEFEQFLENFTFQKPTKQILSNISGELITNFDSKYMVKHMRKTIRIDKCIENLDDEIKVIIEIGPKGILESLVKNIPSGIEVIPTLPSKRQYNKGYDTGDLLHIATRLWMKGYDLNWERICGNYGFDKLLPNYQFEKNICWKYQDKKWNTERIDINLYRPCWIPYKLTTGRRIPKGVILFLPTICTKPIDTLLTTLHNLFVPVQCVFSDTFSTRNLNVMNGKIFINSDREESYQQLTNLLLSSNFFYDTIIHAWNFPIKKSGETERISDDYLRLSFYSIYWTLTNVVRNTSDLRFLVCIDWDAEPEIFTMLGPIRELAMTRPSTQAACILCTSEVNLFRELQLFESYRTDFSLIRNLIDGEFEHFSYQIKQIKSDDYFTKSWDQSICENDCLVRNADVVVIFGFGNIAQSFITVLCQNFDFLTICVASPSATRHFQKLHNKINKWKSSENFRKSRKVDVTNNQHTIVAYDVDVTKEEEVRYLLNQIMLQYGRISVIIHAAAAKVNSAKFEKNFDEIQFVLQPKIRGIRNITDTLREKDISVRSLILNSSMNALFGLPGNNDYAASNAFLDACCSKNFRNIKNITTIQWTGWKDSNMFSLYTNKENKSQNPVANLITEHSLSVQEAEKIIWKCLHERGLIAVSSVSPNEIVHEIRKSNFTISSKSATIPERKKNTEKNCSGLKDIVAQIWMDYLGVKHVTCHDDFFQLGGHSLNGMQIIWEINRVMQIDCKLDDLFQNSQFEKFLQFLQELNINRKDGKFPYSLKDYKVLDNNGKLKRIPLSYPQENMYILRQLQHPTLYNTSFLLTFQGSLCINSLRKAILFLIARQTSLRTIFLLSNNTCYQEIQSLTESYYHITWPHMSEFERCKLINDEKNHVIDLNEIPFRILAMCNSEADVGEIEYMIMISQHHIITDGWSMTIFADELGKLYRYCLTNQRIPETFRRLPWNVTQFAIWQRSDEFTETLQNDLQRLCFKLQELKSTRIVAQKTVITASKLIDQKIFWMPSSLCAQINQTAKRYQQTVYTVMLTAFLCLVRKFSDDYSNDTIVIGCPVSGRVGAKEMKSVMGYFLNNIILIVKDFKMNVASNILFEQVKEAIQEARSFEHLPFHLLVAKLSHQRQHIQQHPIFDIFFNYRHNLDFPKIEISGVKSTIAQLTTNNAFDFACTIDETDGETLITINYNVNKYSVQLIDDMIAVYFKLLKSLSSQSDNRRSTINTMRDLGRKTHQDVLSGSVIDIIEQQSVLTDQFTAFCYSHHAITYRQMYGMIRIFAKKIKQFYLQNNCESIRADTIIPICADSNAIIVPLLAVQLTGAAYAPIDPANSTTMIAQLVQDIGASIIIIQKNRSDLNIPSLSLSDFLSLNYQQCCAYDVDGLNELKKAENKKRLQSSAASYVIFTSGSTGKPKAVCVTNQNLLNFVLTSTQQAVFRPKFRVYHSVNTIFDVSCVNIFTTFSNGSCLIASHNILNATLEIVEKNVNFAFLPSALFNMLDSGEISQLQQLEKLFVGGETPNNEQLHRCLQVGIRICQIYGPTETTVWSLTNNCSILEYECGRVIGLAINNEIAYLLDSENNITCNGGKGELVICGEGVSRGYLNHRANVFTRNKFHTKEEEILNRNMFCYYTGDLAMKFGGKYRFLGRKDKQLKVRGYRVEPTEIEAVIKRWDSSIRNVAVLKNDQLDNLFLFIEKDTDSQYCERLRQYLKEHLLHFMIPKRIITLQRMPLNRSGKIDINKLKEMMENYSADADRTISEICQFDEVLSEEVREIWCQLLGISNSKFEDDFFVIGGHSLLLVLLRHKLRDKFKFDLNFEHFYRQPTLAALIDSIHANASACSKVTNEKITYHNALTFANLRETTSAIGNLYMIHAIAGTIYPYFELLSAIPQCLNIYAIEYEFHYPSNSLLELASFYSKQVSEILST